MSLLVSDCYEKSNFVNTKTHSAVCIQLLTDFCSITAVTWPLPYVLNQIFSPIIFAVTCFTIVMDQACGFFFINYLAVSKRNNSKNFVLSKSTAVILLSIIT